ncbi:hypothetical protein ACLOJK_020309 [Asimina triloba]
MNPASRQINPQFPPDSNLKALCAKGRLKEAILEMAIQGTSMKFHGYDSLLTECVNQKAVREGQRVQAHMIKTRYRPPVYLQTRLIVLFLKCDSLEDARKVFDGMSERNVVSWTAMISGYAQKGQGSEALKLFVQMLETGSCVNELTLIGILTGILPNEFTFATVLTACHGPFGLKHGRQVHSLVIKSKFKSHIFVGSSLLDMYAKYGRIPEAREIFDNLPERDVVSCTAIISGYAQLGFDEEAIVLFRQLQQEGMSSNYVTYAGVLTALSGLAALDYGLQVLELFGVMRGEEVKPDSVTFMAVLSGCSHGGMVNEGLEIFDMMVHEKEVEPEIEHYGCVVDLLGRAGMVDKAFSFIREMPFEPTAAIWGSLLGACRAHGNVPVGEYSAKQLFDIEPQNAGNYVILSNIFAAAQRWEEVLHVRQLMKEKTVMKEPGQSWIKLDRMMHIFHVSDQVHPRIEEIYAKIRELSVKVKEAGYVPDLSCVLHDVDDEQKERMLLGHSEKLSMAFGLICTPDGFPIRVTADKSLSSLPVPVVFSGGCPTESSKTENAGAQHTQIGYF